MSVVIDDFKDHPLNYPPLSKPWHRNALAVTAVALLILSGSCALLYLGVLPNPGTIHLLGAAIALSNGTYFWLGTGAGLGAFTSLILAGVAEKRGRLVLENRFPVVDQKLIESLLTE